MIVGITISVVLQVLPTQTSNLIRFAELGVAFLLVATGVAGYLSADLGAGPTEAAALAWDPPCIQMELHSCSGLKRLRWLCTRGGCWARDTARGNSDWTSRGPDARSLVPTACQPLTPRHGPDRSLRCPEHEPSSYKVACHPMGRVGLVHVRPVVAEAVG